MGSISLTIDGRTVEVFMVGREGITHPAASAAPVRTYSRHAAQADGEAWKIEVGRLRQLCRERPAIQSTILSYASTLQSELEQSAACNALHRAEQRFAKWLLRCHDRIDGDTLNLGQINALIAPLKVDAAGLEQLGFMPSKTVKAAKHYRASSIPAMVQAMLTHLQGVLATA